MMPWPYTIMRRTVVEDLLALGRELRASLREASLIQYRALRQENFMKQTTLDLIQVTNELKANAEKIDAAIDKLVDANNNEDDAKVQEAINDLKGLRDDQNVHLDKLSPAAVEVAKAEPDPEAAPTTSVDNTNGNPG